MLKSLNALCVRPHFVGAVALAMLMALPAAARAQDSPRLAIDGASATAAPPAWSRDATGHVTLRAARIKEPLVIDGRLDERAYTETAAITTFFQQEPHEGEPATEPTEVWLFFDARNIYVSVRFQYSEQGYIVANEMRRDHQNIVQNDTFVVTFDTFHDRRSGYFFQTNALGALRDVQIADDRVNIRDWNTVWDVKTQTFDHGWTAELVIPFKSLRYNGSGPQTWGVNLRRVARWNNEVSFVTPVPASYGSTGVSRFSVAATLVGLETPPPSLNFELKPYGISAVTGAVSADRVRHAATADVGFDAKYGLTKSLTADFTYNTDFAQVEEDEQQVNLTRFSLFFPEKRDFFLEGQGIFAFGGTNVMPAGGDASSGTSIASLTPVLFFSRRIGLDNGREVPILGGGRLTGRVGPYTVGALTVRTSDAEAAGAVATNFSVARVRRDILRKSSIGFIATHRAPMGTGVDTNQALGADVALGLYENVSIISYYARSRTPGEHRDQSSYLGQVAYGADRYGFHFERLFVGEGFKPEVGLLRRTAFHRTYGLGRFSPRPKGSTLVRRYSWEASLDSITDPHHVLESREAQGAFRVTFNSGDLFSSEFTRNYELLTEPFAIATDVAIAPGRYNFQGLLTSYTLGPQRRLNGKVTLTRGSFYDGDRSEASYSGRVEFGPRLAVEPRVAYSWVNLEAGDFTAKIVSVRPIFTLSARAAFGGLIQYNSGNDALSSSLRFRWEYQPGSELFVVYADGRDTSLRGFPSLENRTFAIKITRLFRL